MYKKLTLVISALVASSAALWPLPQGLQKGNTVLKLGDSFDITLPDNAPQDLKDAVDRTKKYLKSDNLGRLVVGRGASDDTSGAKSLGSLALSLSGNASSIAEEATKAIESRDEAYSLNVPSDGSDAKLSANSTLGLFRGLATFGQLWYSYNNVTYAVETPLSTSDKPAYPYRGFMLDTARNYFPVADIKRTIDAMSWVKINTLHWHVVDSQSFPLSIPGFTDIAEKAAYSSEKRYSQDDVKDIVSYAAARGIDVMAEIDTPGHNSAISQAHPEHVACAGRTPWATYANEPPAGQLRIANANTVNFTSGLLTAAAGMFQSKYFSTGGDELNTKCYADDEQTQNDLNSSGQNITGALNAFTNVTHAALKSIGKTPVVWEEMVLNYNVTVLSNDTVILVWISSENAKEVAAKGFKFIHSASDYFYLDCGHGPWVGGFPTGASWCDPFKSWQWSYTFNPTANLTDDGAKLVLGGQHLLWTEQINPSALDSTVWPRAASSAEVFWTGPGGNGTEALPRLHDIAYRMNQRGVGAIALQPEWCAIRPDACDLTA